MHEKQMHLNSSAFYHFYAKNHCKLKKVNLNSWCYVICCWSKFALFYKFNLPLFNVAQMIDFFRLNLKLIYIFYTVETPYFYKTRSTFFVINSKFPFNLSFYRTFLRFITKLLVYFILFKLISSSYHHDNHHITIGIKRCDYSHMIL